MPKLFKKTSVFILSFALLSLNISSSFIQNKIIQVNAINETSTPATIVVGQSGFSSCDGSPNQGNPEKGFFNAVGSMIAGNRLYVSDYGSHRILIYNTIPTSNYTSPDVVIGQQNFCDRSQNQGGLVTASTLFYPWGVFSDGNKLFIVDRSNHRVLIYNTIPTSNNASADVVVGQPDMSSNTVNNGGISASTLNYPNGVFYDGSKLYISDSGNHRVLIYNALPTSNGISADVVVGQPNMTSGTANNGGINANTLNAPSGIYSNGTKLLVSDNSNHRVLIYNTIPTSNNTSADVVVGQPNMTSGTANNGGINTNTLNSPQSIFSNGTKLSIADRGNHRVLIFNTIPNSNNASADVVVGQPNMTSSTVNNGGIGANTLNGPYNTFINDSKMVIVDVFNQRVLIFNTIPNSNNASADVVVGQLNMTNNIYYGSLGPDSNTLSTPFNVNAYNNKLFIADRNNNRVLIYNTLPNSNNANADVVVGQQNFTSGSINQGGSVAANTLNSPNGVFYDGNKLFISEYNNHRILIYNNLPTSNNASADVVVGQPNMTSGTANNGGRNANTLNQPHHIYSDGIRLYVADYNNHRVLIYNTIPTSNNTSADVVVGQPNMTSGTANNGGIGANTINRPLGVCAVGGKFFVADTNNNRVLIYNTIPTSNSTSADVVVGQPNMTSNSINQGGSVAANTLYMPYGVYSDGTRLYIADSYNNRILIYNNIPTSNDAVADIVVGQPAMTTNIANNGESENSQRISNPAAVYSDGSNLYISDRGNERVLIYPLGPQNDSMSTPSFSNSETINITLTADDAKEVMISEDNSFTGATWETYSNSKEYTLSNTTEGTKTIYVKMRDYAHYEGEVLSSSLTYDKTSPNGSVTFNSGDEITNNLEATLTLSASDSLSGVTSMMVSNSSSFSGSTWESYSTSKDWTLSTGDGIKTVYVKFKDAAGNISTIYTDTITLDTGIPEGPITVEEGITHEETLYVKEEIVTLNLEGTDELSEIVLMMISEDPNFEGGSWESYSNTKDWNLSQGDGIKVIYVKYRDGAGNESQIYSLSLIFDTQTTINLSKIGNQDFNSDITTWDTIETKPTFQGTGEVDATVTISIHSNQEITGTATVDSEGNWSYTPETALALGEHTIDISSQDIAGNTDDLNFNLNVLGDTNTTPIELPDTGINYLLILFLIITTFWASFNFRIIERLKKYVRR